MAHALYATSQAMAQERSNRLAGEAVASREALAHLYTAHAPRLYRYFWIHTRCQAAAEDLVSETFLGALRTLPSYRAERGAFSAWLFGIARRTLARYTAQPATMPVSDGDCGVGPEANGQADGPAAGVDERIDLWEAVSGLSGFEREIIALKFGAGLTHPEIGEITGMRAEHVGVTLYRALQKLRVRLAAGGGGDA